MGNCHLLTDITTVSTMIAMTSSRFTVLVAMTVVLACMPPLKLTPSDAERVLSSQTLQAPDPGLKGPFEVLSLYVLYFCLISILLFFLNKI